MSQPSQLLGGDGFVVRSAPAPTMTVQLRARLPSQVFRL
jgi:hypothetical protein